MGKASAAAADGPVFQPGGNEHVEEPFTAILEDERVPVMDRVVARRRRSERIGFGLLEVDAVVTGRKTQMLRPVAHARRVETVVCPFVEEHRTGADGTFTLLGDRDGERMVFPVKEVCRTGLCPLMASQPAECSVVALIQKVEEPEDTVVVKGHAVPDEEVAFRLVVLHGQFGQDRRGSSRTFALLSRP